MPEWRVLNQKDDHYEWPGDEWGSKQTAEYLFEGTLSSVLDIEPKYLCEFGAGSGRYTSIAFERFPDVTILSFDVSVEFEKALKQRCSSKVKSGKLENFLLDKNPKFFLNTMRHKNLIGKIDAIYSFDAMVHVDLHTLFIYWASAAAALRKGGTLAMNVADACNEKGFMKLIANASGVYGLQGDAGLHFMWISKEIVDTILTRLGFEVSYPVSNGRDLFFTAKLLDPDRGKQWFERAGVEWISG
jgi:hypothetical protein